MDEDKFEEKLVKVVIASTYQQLVEAILSINIRLLNAAQIDFLQIQIKNKKEEFDRVEEYKKKAAEDFKKDNSYKPR